MAQKFYDGKVLTMVATAVTTVGQVIPFVDTIGVAQKDAEIGEILTVDTEGVYSFPCEDSTDFAVGARVTYDMANGIITDDPVDGTHVNAGTIWELYTAATGDGNVLVKING
jgi:predicted RecA/RadA family phage recombinase